MCRGCLLHKRPLCPAGEAVVVRKLLDRSSASGGNGGGGSSGPAGLSSGSSIGAGSSGAGLSSSGPGSSGGSGLGGERIFFCMLMSSASNGCASGAYTGMHAIPHGSASWLMLGKSKPPSSTRHLARETRSVMSMHDVHAAAGANPSGTSSSGLSGEGKSPAMLPAPVLSSKHVSNCKIHISTGNM